MVMSTAFASPPLVRVPAGRRPSKGSPSSPPPALDGVCSSACSAVRLPPGPRAGVPAPSLAAPSKSIALPPPRSDCAAA
eukprot:200023-Pleurochrysis_carterae.AAC.1